MKALAAITTILFAVSSLTGCGPRSSAQKFVSIPVRVLDSATMQPISGATVDPLCMGGTPYEKNVYRTDTQGVTRVMVYAASPMLVARIEKDGYETDWPTVDPKDPVVSLKKVQ